MPLEKIIRNNDFAFLSGGGEMGRLIREFPWQNTPLGEISQWPQSLRTALSMVLNSRFPMFFFWGPDLTSFYNDAFRPSLGINGKHPSALGQPGSTVWSEIWDIIKPLLDQVRNGGEAIWAEDNYIPFFRNGDAEEIYWTFSYSAVYDESGSAAGIFVACAETTKKVLNERQMQTLQHLSNLNTANNTVDSVLSASVSALQMNNKDFPFAAIYKLENFGTVAHPIGFAGLEDNQKIFPATISLSGPSEMAMDFLKAVESKKNILSGKFFTLTDLPMGGWDKMAQQFIYIPITNSAYTCPIAVLVAALNPYRKLDGLYNQFIGLISDQISLEMNRALVYEQERRHFESLEAIIAVCVLRGPENIVERANTSILTIWGKRPEQVLSRPFREALPEIRDQGIEEVVNEVRITGKRSNANEKRVYLVRSGNLEEAYINFIYEPVVDPDGTISGVMIIANEVTDLVNSRKTALQSAHKFEEQVRQRTEELVKKNAELEQFAYVSSHDLQEPLRKIQTFADLARRDIRNITVAERYLSKIESSAARMSSLITSMLLYSRMTFPGKSGFQPVNLNEILEGVKDDLEVLILRKSGNILSDPLPTVVADKVQIHQLFSNLIGNALKFSERSPRLMIRWIEADEGEKARNRLSQGRPYIKLSFQDNGIGFDQHYEEKLFNMFQQLNSRETYEGTGIGLALCKKIAENHNGVIRATSKEGEGSTFDVYLDRDLH